MPPVASALLARFASYPALSRRDRAALVITGLLHAAALIIMVATEADLESKVTFLLAWLLLNFFWLALLRRPAIAALVSLAMIAALILLSQFKYDKLMMTVNFVDVMILDTDTIAFFLTIYPDLLRRVILGALIAIPTIGLLWWLDPYRVRRRVASASGTLCLAAAVGISIAAPMDPSEAFSGDGYVSKFVNSGVDAIVDYMTRGYMDSDANVAGNFRLASAGACKPAAKPPHIILILDEFELRHSQRARHQVAPRLRPAFRFLRRQGAVVYRGRRRRPDLVCRIQRAHRLVGALVRSFRLFRHSHRRRSRRTRTAAHAATLRLSDLHPLSGARRLHERAQLSRTPLASSNSVDSKDLRRQRRRAGLVLSMTKPRR